MYNFILAIASGTQIFGTTHSRALPGYDTPVGTNRPLKLKVWVMAVAGAYAFSGKTTFPAQ